MVSSMNGRTGFPDHHEADPSRMQALMDEGQRLDSAEPPRDDATREEAYEAYVAARSTGSRASRRALERAERARARAAARARVYSGDAKTAADQVVNSFRTRPWVRAVSAVMAVLLAVTLFDVTGLRPLMFDVSNDDATAATEQANDATKDENDPTAADANDPAAADADDPAAADAANDAATPAEDATGADADTEAPSAEDDAAADQPAAEPQDPAAAKAALLQQVADEPLDADVLASLKPTSLTDAADVLPRLTDDTEDAAAVASRSSTCGARRSWRAPRSTPSPTARRPVLTWATWASCLRAATWPARPTATC